MIVPGWALRIVGILLAISIALVHISDQGGLTTFALGPDWIGWSYRLIEAGAVLTALALMLPRRLSILGWAAGCLLSLGPTIGFLASRWPGVPEGLV